MRDSEFDSEIHPSFIIQRQVHNIILTVTDLIVRRITYSSFDINSAVEEKLDTVFMVF